LRIDWKPVAETPPLKNAHSSQDTQLIIGRWREYGTVYVDIKDIAETGNDTNKANATKTGQNIAQ
jgi:hypothetical protein